MGRNSRIAFGRTAQICLPFHRHRRLDARFLSGVSPPPSRRSRRSRLGALAPSRAMGRGEDGAELPPPRPSLAGLTTRWDGGASGVDSHRLSVAPMLDCTDTHFRRLCRLVSRRTHLWTEMINQDAVIHARRKNPDMLRHGEEEHPITVQLGGSDPARLARAAAVCDAHLGFGVAPISAPPSGRGARPCRRPSSLATALA